MKHHLIIAALLLLSLDWFSNAGAAILQSWTFEDPDPFHGLTIEGEKPEVVIDPLSPTNHIMKAVLRRTSIRPERSEVRFGKPGFKEERWVGVRIMLPEKNIQPFQCLFQLGPLYGLDNSNAGGWYQILAKSGADFIWSIRGFTERFNSSGVHENTGSIEVEKWTSWVMHYRLSDDASGLVEIWKNGAKVLDRHGRNARRGDRIPLKWGIYIGIGNKLLQDSTVYFDDIFYGNESSSLEEITSHMSR